MDNHCKIFLDTDIAENEVLDLICSLTDGHRDGLESIALTALDVYLDENDEFDDVKRREFPDGFLFFRYLLDIEPASYCDQATYVASISSLLQAVRGLGMKAVAACDFEEQLPSQ